MSDDHQEAVRRAYDFLVAVHLETFKSVIMFGVEAIRTSALINGGATVASLALTGAIFQNSPVQAAAFSAVVLWFVTGVLSAGVASGFTYVAQFLYARRLGKAKIVSEPPFLVVPSSGRWIGTIGALFHVLAVACVLLSYVALGRGGYLVWERFQAFV